MARPGYIRFERVGKKGTKEKSVISFRDSNAVERYNERGGKVLMDSLGYTFFIPGIDVYIYIPPSFLSSLPFQIPLCDQLEIQLPTHFSARRKKKEERGIPVEYSAIQSGQFSVRESVASTLND